MVCGSSSGGREIYCKESAKLRDYFHSRAAHRSRLYRIPAAYIF